MHAAAHSQLLYSTLSSLSLQIKECERCDVHDWTNCPFAHPGEKARRRDPRVCKYSANACPEFRKGVCKRGDACPYSHGVFELWMHPDRFRTQLCREGTDCKRSICFFAHSIHQLRTSTISTDVSSAATPKSASSPLGSPPLVASPPLVDNSCKSSLLCSSIDLASTAPSLSASIDGLSDASVDWLPSLSSTCCNAPKSALLSEALLHQHTAVPNAAALFAPSPLCNLQHLLMQQR